MESQQHRRTFTFENWPVESEDEFVSYAEWLVGVVRDNSAGDEPGTSVAVLRSGNSEWEMPLAEFRARLDEFPFDDMFSATLTVRAGDGGVAADVSRPGFGLELATKVVNIAGTDKARVEGVKAQVRQDGEGRIERLKEAKAKAAADADFKRQEAAAGIGDVAGQIIRADRQRAEEREQRQQPRQKPPPPKEPPSDSEDRSAAKRFFYNPYTIAIITGVILIFIGLAVAAILAA
jgi:hypothetical protein